MKKYLVLLFFILFSSTSIYAVLPLLHLVDQPTAVTLNRSGYHYGFTIYNEGSIQNKAIVGLHDNFYLGVSWDIERLVGTGPISVKIPGVVAKLKLFDQIGKFPLLMAIGYDSLIIGKDGRVPYNVNEYANVIFGPYVVFTKPLFLFNMEQHFNLGVQMPLQPLATPSDTSLFWGFDFPIGNFFVPIFEMNKIMFSADKLTQILYTVAIRCNIVENFSIQFALRMKYKQEIDRVFSFNYAGQF